MEAGYISRGCLKNMESENNRRDNGQVFFKTILDLCGGSGAWSKPYADAGYNVKLIDINNEQDVRLLTAPKEHVHGVLAAPPCTYFCRMRMCRGRPTDEEFIGALSIVDACLRVIQVCKPKWWALENPLGYLKEWLGEPVLKFNPCDYGDPWTKKTWIWGSFNKPKRNPVNAIGPWIHRKKGKHGVSSGDKNNAVTPPGFARAFFEANP